MSSTVARPIRSGSWASRGRRPNSRARPACAPGFKPGDRAIDVGCGPVGALLVLAELVGPAGAVVGLDASAEALTQARQILDRRGLNSVRLIRADINATDLEAVPPDAPFDVAFCRLVPTHQVEPAATLRRIAALLRPGGRIVAQDILEDPRYPSFDPPVPAVERILALQYEHKRRRGVFPDVARHYRTLCGEAGLGLVSQRGLFTVPPEFFPEQCICVR